MIALTIDCAILIVSLITGILAIISYHDRPSRPCKHCSHPMIDHNRPYLLGCIICAGRGKDGPRTIGMP